ncbi:MAG TPA: AI-2E family transporter [Blastocatellia bacterium]|nr:AI-2E family transporter [Blastocatellia bacterium]
MKERSLDHRDMIRLWTLVLIRIILLLLGVAVLILALYTLRTLILLLVLSIFFCYLIAPLVKLLEQPVYLGGREIRLPRSAAIAVVYLVIGVVLFFALQWFLPILWVQVRELVNNLPAYLSSLTAWVNKTFNDASSWMRHVRIPPSWREAILDQIKHAAESSLPAVEAMLGGILGLLKYVPWLIIVPILSFFLLKDAAAIEHGLVAWLPNERLRKRMHWLLLDASRTLAAYIRAQLTACVVVGVTVTIVFGLIGVPYAVVLGLIAGLFEFVPMVGPLLAAAIACGLSLTVSLKLALGVALFLAVFRIVQDYLIYPRIVGHGIKMHPLVVVLAILGGAEIGGLVGVFLAIPIVGMIIVGYNHYLAYRGLQAVRETAQGESEQPELDLSPADDSGEVSDA